MKINYLKLINKKFLNLCDQKKLYLRWTKSVTTIYLRRSCDGNETVAQIFGRICDYLRRKKKRSKKSAFPWEISLCDGIIRREGICVPLQRLRGIFCRNAVAIDSLRRNWYHLLHISSVAKSYFSCSV